MHAIVAEVILPISTTGHQKKIMIKHVDRRVRGEKNIENLLQNIITPKKATKKKKKKKGKNKSLFRENIM